MFEQAFKNIDDVLWKEEGCTTELDYTEQTSWLFVKYLDGVEQSGYKMRENIDHIDELRFRWALQKLNNPLSTVIT